MDVVAGSIVLVSAIAVIDYLRLRRCVSTLTGRMVEARQAADADAEVAAATAEQHRQLRLEMDEMRGPPADCAVGAMCAGETCYQHQGITCEGGHYCCSDCLEQHVRREIAADLTSADQLKRDHRPNGEIRCPDHGRGCRAHLSLHEVAKLVPRKVFDEAFALRRRRIESAAFSKSNSQYEESLQAAEAKLNEKFQQQVDKINADLERRGEQRIAAVQIRVERDRSMLAEEIRRNNPDAKQCARCGFGPMLRKPGSCRWMDAHNGDNGVMNDCPKCGHGPSTGATDWDTWPAWNGALDPEVVDESGAIAEATARTPRMAPVCSAPG